MIIWDRKKKIILGVIIGLVVILIATGVWAYVRYKNKGGSSVIPVKFSDTNVVCQLDGTRVPEEMATRHPLAVMVENHTQARPQAGIDKASVVYETIAEGGITRFMLVYGCYDADKVGPVRSARTYFIDWAEEYNAFYAHAGGAQNALTKIVDDNVLDLNHNSTAFWRQNDGRALEHTLYTTTPKLYQYAQDKGYDVNSSSFTAFKFKDDAAETARPTEEKTYDVNFSSALYNVQWKYNPTTNTYLRYLAGQPHKDEVTDKQLEAKNVVIATYTRRAVESGGKTVYDMTTIGSGEAKILMDGVVITGTWKKEKAGQRTLFYDGNGKEIKFNAGQTWIEAINPDSGNTNA